MPANQYYLPQRGLVEQQGAALIEPPRVPRSKFTTTKQHLTTFDAGDIVPILVDEILPGDHMTYDATIYTRMATPLFPIFSQQILETFWFFCPARLVWEHWVNFMGEQAAPGDSIAYTIPQIVLPNRTGANVNDVYDQMGIPNQNAALATYTINALPLRAYSLIWNQWFRDENVTTPAYCPIDDGPDTASLYGLFPIAKMHNYFTSCLPWPQKFTAPTIPITGAAPISGLGVELQANRAAGAVYETYAGATTYPAFTDSTVGGGTTQIRINTNGSGTPQVFAQLAGGTAGFTVNQFRQAYMIQVMLERDARGGTRYIEHIKSHWGVVSPDFRLQRTEYIGGGKTPLMTTPVAQTAPTTGATVGTLGGATTGAGQHRASYAATEHGYIIGLMAARTEQVYQQGMHKMWTRSTRYDFYDPAFAELGEQAVLQGEIFADGTTNDEIVFGYQEHWHEYRTMWSDTASYFRSTTTLPLDAWHLAQNFASAPTLGSTFLYDTPPMSRILAAGTNANGAQYLADILIRRTAIRAIPAYGTPALLGRM